MLVTSEYWSCSDYYQVEEKSYLSDFNKLPYSYKLLDTYALGVITTKNKNDKKLDFPLYVLSLFQSFKWLITPAIFF